MAGGMGGGGGRRNVNVDLNLVPFIDLLSTLICFLLITAVWSQISVVSTNTSSTTSSDNATPDKDKVDLSISLLLDHLEAAEGTKVVKIPHLNGTPDYVTLLRVLDDWKQRYPDRSDLVIHSDSQAPYKHLIRLMDTAAEAHFDDVGINTN